mmetsp:Transcript_13448/g.22891  ORF Transcript_13448/g.22891 Transcript_13448/m.22891 type:complete len:97 (+) Transcript_13448:471-761(+)
MRCTPLAVYLSRVKDVDLVREQVKIDVEFTHPSPIVTSAIALYSYAIILLLGTDSRGAQAQDVFDEVQRVVDSNPKFAHPLNGSPNILKEWLSLAR